MIEFIRAPFDFTPIPFALVSNEDHVTPVVEATPPSYYISMNGDDFIIGDGPIAEVGRGFYQLFLGKTTQAPVPRTIVIPTGSGYDAVYLRVAGVGDPAIAPVSQGQTYPFVFLWDTFSPPLPGLKPVVHISRNGIAFDDPIRQEQITPLSFGCFVAAVPIIEIPHTPNDLIVYLLRGTVPDADPDDPTAEVVYDSFQVFRYLAPA